MRAFESNEATNSTYRKYFWGLAVFMMISVVGLYYVKWEPYYHKAVSAAAWHSIGQPIFSGNSGAPPSPSWTAAGDYAWAYFLAVWKAMILGLLLGSAVEALLPKAWLYTVFGGTRFKGVALAGLASIPTMMCTCCAAPVALGLRKNGSSVGASLAYWLGNPILNPATMVFMGFVLGWHWVGLRVVVGVLLVFVVAYAVGRFAERDSLPSQVALAETEPAEFYGSIWIAWINSFWRLSKRLIPETVILVCLLGAARAWLFPTVTPNINGMSWTIALAFTGTLFVIPTAGEIPVVQALLSFGLGTGPAGALLTTLPALSLPSLLLLYRTIPLKALAMTWFAVFFAGILSGGAAMLFGF